MRAQLTGSFSSLLCTPAPCNRTLSSLSFQTALQYSSADFQNLQRRSAEELAKGRDFAIQRFASDLLSTIDILTLALKHVPAPIPSSNPELKTLADGVTMTQTELLKTLKKHGVVQFDPTGEKFDPNLHEALYQAPIPGKEVGTVCETTTLGYMLKDRTLRAAQVGVVSHIPPSSSRRDSRRCCSLSPPRISIQVRDPDA